MKIKLNKQSQHTTARNRSGFRAALARRRGLKLPPSITSAIKSAQGKAPFAVGDILYSQWGYEQTNVGFYKVIKATAKTVVVRMLQNRVVKTTSSMSGYVVPADEFRDGVIEGEARRRIKDDSAEQTAPYIDISPCETAHPWNGKPVEFSSWA